MPKTLIYKAVESPIPPPSGGATTPAWGWQPAGLAEAPRRPRFDFSLPQPMPWPSQAVPVAVPTWGWNPPEAAPLLRRTDPARESLIQAMPWPIITTVNTFKMVLWANQAMALPGVVNEAVTLSGFSLEKLTLPGVVNEAVTLSVFSSESLTLPSVVGEKLFPG